MPTTRVFVDTNVLLYAVSDHPDEAEKRTRALQLLARDDFGLSLQVMQEFFVNATTKLEPPLTSEEAVGFLDRLQPVATAVLDYKLFREAVRLRDRYQISYWDAAVIAAAKTMGATTLYSEDLADGQVYDSVRVVNPFLGKNE